ncbi:hypothetical protein [Dickeya ananatis]
MFQEEKLFFSEKLNKKLPQEKRRGIAEAKQFAEELGFPVFVKPNNLSQGEWVTKIYDIASMAMVGANIFFSYGRVTGRATLSRTRLSGCCSGRDCDIGV